MTMMDYSQLIVIGVGAVGSVLLAIFKPKTPEEYAAMSPRAAAFWKLMSALLPDLVKSANALAQLKSGASDVQMRLPAASTEAKSE